MDFGRSSASVCRPGQGSGSARVPKTWLCPASWPMKASWVNIIPTSGATARAAHESPAMTNSAHPAKKAEIVRVIFTV